LQTGDRITHISAHNSTSEGTPYLSNIEDQQRTIQNKCRIAQRATLPQHHIHVYHCHSTLTDTPSYWSQHGDSFCSTNYHITKLGVHSPLPTADYIPGHY